MLYWCLNIHRHCCNPLWFYPTPSNDGVHPVVVLITVVLITVWLLQSLQLNLYIAPVSPEFNSVYPNIVLVLQFEKETKLKDVNFHNNLTKIYIYLSQTYLQTKQIHFNFTQVHSLHFNINKYEHFLNIIPKQFINLIF